MESTERAGAWGNPAPVPIAAHRVDAQVGREARSECSPPRTPREGTEWRVSADQGRRRSLRVPAPRPRRGRAARGQLTRDSGGHKAQEQQQERGQHGPEHDSGCGRRAARLGNAGRCTPSHPADRGRGRRGWRGGRGGGQACPLTVRSRRRAARCNSSASLRNFLKLFIGTEIIADSQKCCKTSAKNFRHASVSFSKY